ncbi:hypothetical protein D1871_12765 [Nakamurella silvestris]|nr:hypothetical protein D1871_12765 [Nakamurella silvestris]
MRNPPGHVRQALVLLLGMLLALTATIGPATAAPLLAQHGATQKFPPGTLAKYLPKGVSWGHNSEGELGTGIFTDKSVPVLVDGGTAVDGKEISSIDAGYAHQCEIAEQSLYCWGWNKFGQLGTGAPADTNPTPALVQGLLDGKKVTAVSAGGLHTCAIADGAAYCWGDNTHSQLGIGSHLSSTLPTKVRTDGALAGKTVTAISAGSYSTCAIATNRAYCWGSDDRGQLGDGLGKSEQLVPTPVNTASGLGAQAVDSIAAGAQHSCALTKGTAYCWGANDFGQLGDGSTNTSTVPVVVGIGDRLTVKSVAAGPYNSCAIAEGADGADRVALCWGKGADGLLGTGTPGDASLPQRVKPQGGFVNQTTASITMAAGGGCVVESGKGYCWGTTSPSGRLGNANNPPVSAVPVPAYTAGVLNGRTLLEISTEIVNTAGIAVTTPHFTDVNNAYTFKDDITWLAGTGTALGYEDGKYQPTADITRQAMAAFLFRYANPGVSDPVCDPMKDRTYNDVHTMDAFCGPIEWLAAAGLNPPGGDFHPGATTQRGVMATWLYRTHHSGSTDLTCTGGTHFTDVDVNSKNCGAIDWLSLAGITNGYDDGSFRPKDPVHRDSMAAFFHRLSALTTH